MDNSLKYQINDLEKKEAVIEDQFQEQPAHEEIIAKQGKAQNPCKLWLTPFEKEF